MINLIAGLLTGIVLVVLILTVFKKLRAKVFKESEEFLADLAAKLAPYLADLVIKAQAQAEADLAATVKRVRPGARPVSGQTWLDLLFSLVAGGTVTPESAKDNLDRIIATFRQRLEYWGCDPDNPKSVLDTRWAIYPVWVERLLGYYTQVDELEAAKKTIDAIAPKAATKPAPDMGMDGGDDDPPIPPGSGVGGGGFGP